MATIKRSCDNCKKEYNADQRNILRGWGLSCSKSCAASLREKAKPSYNPDRVALNNVRRELWNCGLGVNKKTRYTSEGYRIINGTAYDEFDEPVYAYDENEDEDCHGQWND